MRPKRWTFTLAALDADGYVASANVNSVAVGGSYTIRSAVTHPRDGCGHPVSVYSAGDITGTVFTVTGVDPEGRSISEDITGLNNDTALSLKYFADVTSVVRKSGATGAVAFTVGYTAVAVTPIVPVSPYDHNGPMVGIDVGGTINYDLQATNGNVFVLANATLFFDGVSGMTGKTADATAAVGAGATGVRVKVNSHTSGTLAITITQDSNL